MKDTMVLKDGTAIEIEMASAISAIGILSEDKTAMVALWDKFTDENLSEVQIKNSEGMVAGRYSNLVLVQETSSERVGGKIYSIFSFREKTETEKLREEIEAVKKTVEVHDGAIADLGDVTGAIALKVDGGEV